jgi:hypothetical protein
MAKNPKNILAQAKLKDFQEGEMVMRKSLWLRTGKPRNKTSRINSKPLAFRLIFSIRMNANLNDKKVAILVTDGFEQNELHLPCAALEEAKAASCLALNNHCSIIRLEQTKNHQRGII